MAGSSSEPIDEDISVVRNRMFLTIADVQRSLSSRMRSATMTSMHHAMANMLHNHGQIIDDDFKMENSMSASEDDLIEELDEEESP